MKILQVTNFFPPSWESGGVTRAAYDICKEISRRGHEVTVYTTNRSIYDHHVIKNIPVKVDGMTVYYFENFMNTFPPSIMPEPFPVYAILKARKELGKFDVVHIHGHRTFLEIISSHYAKKFEIPYIIQAHGSVPDWVQKSFQKKAFDTICGRAALDGASRCIALNEKEKDQYRIMGVSTSKIEIVPNGVQLEDFEELPEKGEFRRQYGLTVDSKTVLFLGRISRIKGIDVLLEAIAVLAKDIEDLRLVIIGPDAGFLEECKSLIHRFGIEDRVIITGPIVDIEKKKMAFIDSDVYVLPSRYETFPMGVLEAWACNVPVIVTPNCGIAEYVVDNGGLVVELDVRTLAKGIWEILSNQRLAKEFASNGSNLVRTRFNVKSIVDSIEGIYGQLS